MKSLLKRYAISTLGLIIVALGVGLSIKSNLGIAPPSCPPTILSLKWSALSVGTFTWITHIVYILTQWLLLGKRFELRYLMQIPAAFVFGYMCDASIWLFNAIEAPATNYLVQILLSLAAVVLTAIGIKLEVVGDGWILAGDKLVAVLSEVTRSPFSRVKVIFDIVLVALTAAFSFAVFGLLDGNGHTVVIREGTLILAILTGICMRFTDPLIDRIFSKK
ncbi:MAG: hypothetical protein IJ813_01195 [Bacteroidales bacterium]|nr:hypothetical protein [Bacteroidales bacterium]